MFRFVAAFVPRVALRLPWAVLCSPFGAKLRRAKAELFNRALRPRLPSGGPPALGVEQLGVNRFFSILLVVAGSFVPLFCTRKGILVAGMRYDTMRPKCQMGQIG